MALTREQWEASDCHEKSICRISMVLGREGEQYRLCSNCRQRIQDPSFAELCRSAPHPLCKSMKEGEPTAKQVLQEFLDTVEPKKHCTKAHINRAISLLEWAMSREWDCVDCEYWEDPRGGADDEPFLSTHGVSIIPGWIPSFCSYFIIRKTIMRENEKRRCYTVMSKLTDFLFDKSYITEEDKKEIKKSLTICRSVDSDKIFKALQDLKEQGYWESLVDEEIDDDEFGGTAGDDLPMRVKEVREDGWVFEKPFRGRRFGSSDEDDDSDDDSDDELLLRLPKDVAKLGRKGMEISCMNLQSYGGIWSPYNPYGGSFVCANIYPPS